MKKRWKVLLVMVAVICIGVAASYPIRYYLEEKGTDDSMERLLAMRDAGLASLEDQTAREEREGDESAAVEAAGEANSTNRTEGRGAEEAVPRAESARDTGEAAPSLPAEGAVEAPKAEDMQGAQAGEAANEPAVEAAQEAQPEAVSAGQAQQAQIGEAVEPQAGQVVEPQAEVASEGIVSEGTASDVSEAQPVTAEGAEAQGHAIIAEVPEEAQGHAIIAEVPEEEAEGQPIIAEVAPEGQPVVAEAPAEAGEEPVAVQAQPEGEEGEQFIVVQEGEEGHPLMVQVAPMPSATPEVTATPAPTPTPTATPVPTPTPNRFEREGAIPYSQKEKKTLDVDAILPQYKEIYEENHDFVGWITIPGTVVDYPVVQTEQNDYYLRKDFYGKKNANGTIILDSKCDPYTPSYNLVISGHSMRSGKMFGRLVNYMYKSYWEKHKMVYFDTLMEQKEYVVLAAFFSADYDVDEEGFRYNVDIQYSVDARDWLQEIHESELYDTGIEAEFGDEFLTLTTCNNAHRKDGRFVVICRRVREGEIIQ